MGLRGRDARPRRPRLRPRGIDATGGGDPPGQRRAHQRRPLLRRSRPPRVLHARVRQRPRRHPLRQGRRADPGPFGGGRHPDAPARPEPGGAQEQLGRQGQLLRRPRELPDGPLGAVRPHRGPRHAPLRVPADLHRGREGGQRGAAGIGVQPADQLPADPAGRLLRGGGRAGDHAEAAHRQHPRRAALRLAEIPPAPRDRGRRQHVRGRQLPKGRDHLHSSWP